MILRPSETFSGRPRHPRILLTHSFGLLALNFDLPHTSRGPGRVGAEQIIGTSPRKTVSPSPLAPEWPRSKKMRKLSLPQYLTIAMVAGITTWAPGWGSWAVDHFGQPNRESPGETTLALRVEERNSLHTTPSQMCNTNCIFTIDIH